MIPSNQGHVAILVAVTLAAAAIIHGLYRMAESWERQRAGRSRDVVMLPSLLVLVLLVAFAADWLGEHDPPLLRDGGFAVFLGFAIGQRLPRPRRAGRR